MLPGPQMPAMTDPTQPMVQYPGVRVEGTPSSAGSETPITSPRQPAASSAEQGGEAVPLTRERVQQMLDNLDLQLADGKISEARYDQLSARWENRLKEFG